MTIDWTKPIQTRDGRRAEFVGRCGPLRDGETVIIVVDNLPEKFYENGQYYCGARISDMDITNVPTRKETREVVAWCVIGSAGLLYVLSPYEDVARRSCGGVFQDVVRLTGTYEVEVAE